jgi:hypothetical protein
MEVALVWAETAPTSIATATTDLRNMLRREAKVSQEGLRSVGVVV